MLGPERRQQLHEGDVEGALTRQKEGEVIQPEFATRKGSAIAVNATNLLYDPKVLDAYDYNTNTIDPEFGVVMSLATENWLYNQTIAADQAVGDVAEFTEEAPAGLEVGKGQDNNSLGREVFRAWKRQKAIKTGQPTDAYLEEEKVISPEAFTVIGDMAKEIYSEANPDVLYRPPQANQDSQIYFQLTPEGTNKLRALNRSVSGLFDAPEVAPLNAVSNTAQPQFEAQTRVRKITTKVGELGDTRQINESMRNYHSVKFVNDPKRENFAIQFGILALLNNGQDNVYANMYDIGLDAVKSVEGKKVKMIDDANRVQDPEKKRSDLAKADAYDTKQIISANRQKFLGTLDTIGKYSDSVNHLTYSMQALTGRTHVQQTKYNPQAHKALRWVVGGGNVYTINPKADNSITKNFKEIMGALFAKGVVDGKEIKGKDLDTTARLNAFDQTYKNGGFQRFINAGNEILQANENFKGQAAAAKQDIAAVVEAIRAGNESQANQLKINLRNKYSNDPLSEETKLILKQYGDEGPHIADALAHLAMYDNAVKNNGTFPATLTVEMDGKTHGPATNAAILGVKEMASRTGLLREQDYTLTDDIDSRIAMGEYIIDNVGSLAIDKENPQAWVDIAKIATQDRANFLKKSPMTMGYGQELGSLRMHVETTVYNGPQADNIRSIMNDAKLEPDQVIDFLHSMLVNSIFAINSDKVVAMSRLLRANNLLSTMTNEVLYMDNASGFRSYAAAKQVQPEAKNVRYTFEKDGKKTTRKAQLYETKAEGSAVRQYEPNEPPVPGGFGHGRIVPIAVQSYDANMVSKTGSGRSWDKIKNVSKVRGTDNAFVLPIFDAFVTDLGTFDTVREESNRNWVDGLREHSYVQSIMDTWYKETTAKVKADFAKRNPNEKITVDKDSPYRGVHWLFNEVDPKGRPMIHYMLKKVLPVRAKRPQETIAEYQAEIGKLASDVRKTIDRQMKSKGIPLTFTELTNQQLSDLINIVVNNIQLGQRNSAAVSKISRDKADLFREFDRIGKKARQVDIA